MQYRFTQTILHSQNERQVEGKKHFTNRQKGALNNESDPDYIKRSKHAKLYYEEIINSTLAQQWKLSSEQCRSSVRR